MTGTLREKFKNFIKKHIVDDMPPALDDEANYGFLIADIAKAENVHPEQILRLKAVWELMGIKCNDERDFHQRVKTHLKVHKFS